MHLYKISERRYIVADDITAAKLWCQKNQFEADRYELIEPFVTVLPTTVGTRIERKTWSYCRYLGCTPKDLRIQSRKLPDVKRRAAVGAALRADGFTYTEIANVMRRHHAAVYNAVKRYKHDELTKRALRKRDEMLGVSK